MKGKIKTEKMMSYNNKHFFSSGGELFLLNNYDNYVINDELNDNSDQNKDKDAQMIMILIKIYLIIIII